MRIKKDDGSWHASGVLVRDARSEKSPNETPNHRGKKDTKRWCKGKVLSSVGQPSGPGSGPEGASRTTPGAAGDQGQHGGSTGGDGTDLCPKCRRPKATPRDVIRWLSDADGYSEACFDGADYPRLLPEESATTGAERLKERLVELRRQKDWLLCLAVAGTYRR